MRHLSLLTLSLSLLCRPVQAATVVNGGTLLNQTQANTIASWLGEGDLVLTAIYSGPSDPAAWHGAVDNLGRTITVIMTDLGLIGGYNPQSWNGSLGTYVYTANPVDRTAFIFNLTTGLLQLQQPGYYGGFQTVNDVNAGPSFGGGWDIKTNDVFLASSARALSYSGTVNLFGGTGITLFQVIQIETFTITSAVPEPGTMALAGLAFVALGWKRRKKR